MRLESIRVIHWLKSGLTPEALANRVWERMGFVPGALFLNSCQRVLFVCTQTQLNDQLREHPENFLEDAQILAGTEAYIFLLRVATGLESQVLGETDIFGQLKLAWKQAQEQPQGLAAEVDFWAQKLFEDAKEVRAQYLENLGGASYGSLVRLFLKERGAGSGPVLLIGAGQLAQAVLPFLNGPEILLWNRRPEKLSALRGQLVASRQAAVKILETGEEEARAWREASQVIVCIPRQIDTDERRISLWNEGCVARGGAGRFLLHLGAQSNEGGPWNGVCGAFFLDDLFALRKAQGEARSAQVKQATRACDERAKLRALDSSVCVAHGWEDLAVFA